MRAVVMNAKQSLTSCSEITVAMRSPVEPLLVDTTHGPILGFLDSYHLEARSKAAAVLRGETGNRSPVAKWLVSLHLTPLETC